VPRLTLTATHDDNLFLTAEEAESSYFVDLIPGVLLVLGRPDDSNIFLDAGTIIQLYDSSKEVDNRVNYLLTLGGQRKTPKNVISASAGYRYREDIDTVVGGRVAQDDYLFNAGIEQDISAKTSAGLDGSYEINYYEDPVLVDNRRLYGSASAYYKNTESRSTFLRLGMGTDHPGDNDTVGDSDFYEILLGMRGKQSPKLVLSGSAGYQWRTFADDDEDELRHWVAGLNIESTPFGLTTVYGDVATGIRPAANSLGQTTIDQRYTVGLRRQLFTKRLQGAISGFLGNVDYYGQSVVDPSINFDREDEYWGYNIGLDYWTPKNISIGLDYSFYKNEGNRQGTDQQKQDATYDQGRWVLRTSWNF